ncbi:Crp/Fnr family transcriptional regulator [Methylobacterium isbiliense]|uniref:Uncharacterized protein n=1 Tax=Methylobacterium isbiliense TaxID=315478 RepID=A0ABQ4SM40_9HYPH|nr:Crp/Fnr family transcriptional regulator [Methylobacterium isbiliense]MDN3626069.1 Crp/Fnr family transcriptional regulator [Methylobacterium isbiliense]GJE04292.1 hypothetical protein GMJLKIPL_6253 [Methylobacterium isbiliense]
MIDAQCAESAWDKAATAVSRMPRTNTRLPRLPAGLSGGVKFRNTLLAALTDQDFAALRPALEPLVLRRRQVLHERNAPVAYVYFIERGTASLLCRVAGRESVEVGALGRGDLVGVSAVLGTARAPHRCVVQVPGEALRIRTEDLRRAMITRPALRSLLLAHVQARLIETAQLMLCNTHHSLDERLARSLLRALDDLDGDEIPLTHRALSQSLSVRRAGVTTALGEMEMAGLVRRGRGRLKVLDRGGLEQAACECHRIVRAERRRLVCETVVDQDGT